MAILALHQLRSSCRSRSSGFTIVELLIVIVVIGILATITIVSYNGIQTRARITTLKSDLKSASQTLLQTRVFEGGFPSTLAAANEGKGVNSSPGTVYQYSYDNTAGTFCITASNGSLNYNIIQNGTISDGACPGHTASMGIASMPTRAGYYDFSQNYDNTTDYFTVTPPTAIPAGSWMIIILAYTNSVTVDPPAGWTAIIARDTTNTMQTAVYAKIKDSSDTNTFSIYMPSGGETANGVILWGNGAAPVSNWVLGTLGKRIDNATSTTTVAPGVATTKENTLVLSFSTERTSSMETDITSLSGATKWFYTPQLDTSKIQTVTAGYIERATPGTTSPVTVTYPNSQSYNGMAFQLAIPPAS